MIEVLHAKSMQYKNQFQNYVEKSIYKQIYYNENVQSEQKLNAIKPNLKKNTLFGRLFSFGLC